MLKLPTTVRIFACTVPCDMRKQIDGLAALVKNELGQEARSGDLFLAFNRRRDMVRLLFWDRNGFILTTKRLETGTFRVPWSTKENINNPLELEAAELSRILEGVEPRRCRRSAAGVGQEKNTSRAA